MPRHHPTLPRTTASALHRTSPKPRDNVDRNPSRGNRDMMPEEPISPPRQIRASPSPSRPSKINALSPLQAFSPLQPMTVPRDRSNTASEASSAGTRSRASSITKSLSRRQSLIAHAARWGTGEDYEDDSSMSSAGLFSRLTLVKAPNEESGLKR
jgi:hypothetical protein